MAEALALGRARGWKYLELRDVPAWLKTKVSSSYYHHELDLGKTKAELFAGFEGSVRRAIRKAEGSGLTLEISTKPPALEEYYRLHSMTRKRHGLPPQPRRFFMKLASELLAPEKGFVVLTKVGSKAVAGAVFLLFNGAGVYKFGASDRAHQHLRPNQLVMWGGMRRLQDLGARVLSFGRTSMENEGLRRFKSSWGASEKLISYLRYDLQKGQVTVARDHSTGIHTSIFRVMPVWANQLFGRVLYRHLA